MNRTELLERNRNALPRFTRMKAGVYYFGRWEILKTGQRWTCQHSGTYIGYTKTFAAAKELVLHNYYTSTTLKLVG